MELLKYKSFKTSEAFEDFQKENDVKISTISPIAQTGGGAVNDKGEIDMEIEFGCFVVYFESDTLAKE